MYYHDTNTMTHYMASLLKPQQDIISAHQTPANISEMVETLLDSSKADQEQTKQMLEQDSRIREKLNIPTTFTDVLPLGIVFVIVSSPRRALVLGCFSLMGNRTAKNRGKGENKTEPGESAVRSTI